MQKYLVTWKGSTREIEANSEFDAKVRATHIFATHTTSDSISAISAIKKFDQSDTSEKIEEDEE